MPDGAAKPIAHPWSSDALLVKAQKYAELMLSHGKDDWRFGLWSALSLELLLRASLARISPALLADKSDWNSLYFGLGHEPTAPRFVPRSITATEVATRLEAILPELFTSEMKGFSIRHMNVRNEELHTGASAFEEKGTYSWLPEYYLTCESLLKPFGKELAFLFGDAEATVAAQLTTSFKDESAKSVGKAIADSKTHWEQRPKAERTTLVQQAIVWASRHDGHRVKCPSCGSAAIVIGSPAGPPVRSMAADKITEKQEFLPTKFECIACGLKVSGLSQLAAAGVGMGYTSTSTYDPSEMYDGPEWEDDFNEY